MLHYAQKKIEKNNWNNITLIQGDAVKINELVKIQVDAIISESYRKKQYPAHFVSKISDANMENSETQTWLEFSLACKYINYNIYSDFIFKSEEIGKLLNHMLNNPGKY